MWGGPGASEPCTICGQPVGQLGLDLEFVQDADAATYTVHVDCYGAWQAECENFVQTIAAGD
jgi:hypothetical protein